MARRAASPAHPWIHPDLRQLAQPIGELTPHPRNARRHSARNIAAITESLREHGQVRAAVVTTKPLALAGRARAPAGTVLIGNGMLQAALDLGWSHLACIPFAGSATEARKLALRDNRTAELGEWEPEALGADLGDLRSLDVDLGLLGWDPGDLVGLLDDSPAGGGGDDPGAQVDRAAELQAKWGTALGQLWAIPSAATPGRVHRLLCSDWLAPGAVERVTGGEAPALVAADPPYGVAERTDRASKGRGKPFGSRAKRSKSKAPAPSTDYAPVVGDDRPFDPTSLVERFPRLLLWGANHYAPRLPPSPTWIVWDKRDAMTSDDNADCELAWSNLGGPARLCHHRWRGLVKASERGEKRLHPTQKPAALAAWFLERWTARGDLVLDPFCGAGYVIIGAEQTGRLGAGIEIVPGYVAATLERLAGMGLKPRLVE